MATWTDKYNNQLRAAYTRQLISKSRSGSVVRPGPQDIAYQMLQRSAKNRHLGSEATGTGSKSLLRKTGDVGKYLLEALGTGNYAVANAMSELVKDKKNRVIARAVEEGRAPNLLDVLRPDFTTAGLKGAFEGAAAGLMPGHQDGQKMFQDVLKENHVLDNHSFARGVAGFGLDVGADPLTYVGPGIFANIGRHGARKGAEKALEKGIDDVLKHGDQALNPTTKVTAPEAEKAFDSLYKRLNDAPQRKPFETKQGPLAIEAGPNVAPSQGFAASADGTITPTQIWTRDEPFDISKLDDFNPDAPARLNIKDSPADLLTARTRFETIQEQVEKIPWYRYPEDLDVIPTVKEVTERVAPKMPKQKRGKADILPEGAIGPEMAHTWATGIGEEEARRIAARQAILGDENYTIRMKSGKPYKLPDLYKTAYAQTDPKKREQMLKMIDDQVNKGVETILKGDDIRNVPVYMRGASGEMRRTGNIPIDALAKFIRDGMLAKPSRYESAPAESLLSGKGIPKEALEQDELLAKYPVADPDEINNFLIRTPQGEMSLGQLFAQTNKERWVEKMGKDVKKIKKLDKASKLAWRAKYADVLDPQDMDNLLEATSLKDFKSRLSTIMAAEGTRKSGLDGLEQGIKEGLIRKEDLKPLMDALGISDVKRLVPKIREAGEQLLRLERAAKKNEPTPVLEDFLEEGIEGWAKTSGYSPDATFDKIVDAINNVKPADELIDSVKAGDATDFLVTKNRLDPRQVEMYESAFQRAWTLNIIDPKDYPFVTSILRAKRTHKKMYEGKARNWRGWNKYSQADVYRSVINDINDVLKTSYQGVKGAGRSRAVYDYAMPVLRAVEDTLKANGVPMILGKGKEGVPLGLFDVLNSLPRKLVENHLFDFGRSLAPTQFNDIAEILVEFGRKNIDETLAMDSIRAVLLAPVKSNPKAKPFTPQFLHWMQGTGKNKNYRFRGNPKTFIDALSRDFLESTPVLMQQLERNAAQFKLATDAMAKPITDEVITNVTKMFRSPAASNGDRIEMLDSIDALAEAVGKHNKASSHARQAAKDDLKTQMGESVDAGAAFEAQAGKANTRAAEKNGGKVPRDTAFGTAEIRYETNQKLIDDVMPELDLPGRIEMGFFASIARAFNPHFNVGDLRRLYNEGNTAGEASARAFQHLANRAAKMHTEEDVKRAWVSLQMGKPAQTPEVGAAIADLQAMMRNVFDTNATYNSIRRFGLDAEQINRWMKHYGVPEMYRFDPQDLANSWKYWDDVHDPLDLITRVNAAVQHAQTLSVTGASFTHFGKQAGAISTVPRSGFKKLSGKGIEEVAPYINLNLHYSPEAIENLRFFNQFLREAKIPLGQNKLARSWDSAMHAIKAGYTIYRPGHHVRNAVGNISLNFLAGMTNPRYYKDALRMLSNQRGRMGDWDKITALRNEPVTLPAGRLNAANAKTKIRMGSGTETFSDEQIIKLAHQHGVLPDYQALEDIAFAGSAVDSEAGFLSKLPGKLRQPFGGKVRRAAGMTSQLNDHTARLAQFIWELERKSWGGKNLHEIAQEAARRTRKWHPDGTDLTNFERRGMRRAILFYSWQRKIIPLVAESMFTRPGRVMVYPKAYYNFAQSMGLDLNSLADPFPQDQLFPSWMTDQATGPLFQNDDGHYMGINPGVVQTDVLNQYGSPEKFMRATLGGITPFVKIPFELATGTDVATGARIMDKSEYLDRQIPMVGSVGGMFNVSPTGGFEDKREVTKEYENAGMDPNAVINFFTGLGLTDMSKPNYIKSAEFELKDQARKDAIEWEKDFRKNS